MIVSIPTPDSPATTLHPRGNGVDLHYLQEARTSQREVIAFLQAASRRATRPAVRGLVRDALSEHTSRLEAISASLLPWNRPQKLGPSPAAPDRLPELPVLTLDRAVTERLTAHAHATIHAARSEMVAGSSERVRAIAQEAIRAGYRLLAALDAQLGSSARRPTPERGVSQIAQHLGPVVRGDDLVGEVGEPSA